MTLQFKTQNGWKIIGLQIGPPDIAATLSSATSVWGWMNGMAGVQRTLAYFRNPVLDRRIERIFTVPELLPATFGIVTLAQGVNYLRDSENQTAFGGDPRTQIFALSICALAHAIGPPEAVIDLFMDWLAPLLLSGITSEVGGIRETLYAQLIDNYPVILNEGATRCLPQRFSKAIEDLHLPSNEANARRNWNDELLKQYGNSELSLVAGLMRWIGMEEKQTYFSRSSLVLKVAACFKSIGYILGPLQTWTGSGSLPSPYGGVVLVLGGSMPTDSLLPSPAEFQGFSESSLVFHYRYVSIGALLCSSISNPCDIRPEVFQTLYESVADTISRILVLFWQYDSETDNVCAKPHWRKDKLECSSVSIRLASIHFQQSAEELAPCYEGIADEKTLDAVLKSVHIMGTSYKQKHSSQVVRFRAITASIIFAVSSQLAGQDFYDLQHATTLTMDRYDAISQVAKTIDLWLSTSLSLSRGARLIAIVHCGIDVVTYTRDSPQTIGWRSGIYTVMPSLFFEKAPTSAALGFCCKDEFFGNVPVYKDGRILDITPQGIMEDRDITEELLKHPSSSAQRQIYFGPPTEAPPDTPLYLSIERRCKSSDSNVCLCARIDGEMVGIVSVFMVVKTIAQSLQTPSACPSHTASYQILNVSPSLWAKSGRCQKPSGSPCHTYIPVKDDRCWALFLAGEHRDWVTISRGCVDCAIDVFASRLDRSVDRRVRVVGYEKPDRSKPSIRQLEHDFRRI